MGLIRIELFGRLGYLHIEELVLWGEKKSPAWRPGGILGRLWRFTNRKEFTWAFPAPWGAGIINNSDNRKETIQTNFLPTVKLINPLLHFVFEPLSPFCRIYLNYRSLVPHPGTGAQNKLGITNPPPNSKLFISCWEINIFSRQERV